MYFSGMYMPSPTVSRLCPTLSFADTGQSVPQHPRSPCLSENSVEFFTLMKPVASIRSCSDFSIFTSTLHSRLPAYSVYSVDMFTGLAFGASVCGVQPLSFTSTIVGSWPSHPRSVPSPSVEPTHNTSSPYMADFCSLSG